MNRFWLAGVFFGVVLATGCSGNSDYIAFDSAGWGGPNSKYTQLSSDELRIESGMLVNEGFQWADADFSLEFLDEPDLVWGFRLLDVVFAEARHEALRNTRVRIGDRQFVLGRDLPPEEMWKFDTMLDVEFRRDKEANGYRILDAVWYGSILDDGKRAVRVAAAQKADVRPNAWNTLSVTIRRGILTCAINGVEMEGVIKMDPRTNGRLGIFVRGGGPLCVRKLTFGPQSPN